MFRERAKAAANQVDPVVLAPPVYATAPPPGSPGYKPAVVATPSPAKPKARLAARRQNRKPGRPTKPTPKSAKGPAKFANRKMSGVTASPIAQTTQALWRERPVTTPTAPSIVSTTQASWGPTAPYYASSQSPWQPPPRRWQQRRRPPGQRQPPAGRNQWQKPAPRARKPGNCIMNVVNRVSGVFDCIVLYIYIYLFWCRILCVFCTCVTRYCLFYFTL